jgi:hypothetical protein
LEAIAARLHSGQVDGRGVAYIEHLRAVAAGVSPEARAVALFHDSMEDTGASRSELLAFGLTPREADAVELLTRPAGMAYGDYIERVANAPGLAGELARAVKLSDLSHNAGRLVPALEHLRPRYTAALDRLE